MEIYGRVEQKSFISLHKPAVIPGIRTASKAQLVDFDFENLVKTIF